MEKNAADVLVLQQLSQRISINDLMVASGLRRGTIVASLKRLEAEGLTQRIWDGNQRFGRYLYQRVAS